MRGGDESSFHAAISSTGEDTEQLVYVTEDTGGEWVTLLVPWAPAAFANFGVGALSLLERSGPAAERTDAAPRA